MGRMRFFFDNCVSPKLARAMHALAQPEHEVQALRERYANADVRSIEDTRWLSDLGVERDWIVVSGDISIRRRPGESAQLKASKLTTFFMAEGYTKTDKWEQVRWMIEKWPEIVRLAGQVAAGGLFRVPRRGKIETL
jgi:PIN like domain